IRGAGRGASRGTPAPVLSDDGVAGDCRGPGAGDVPEGVLEVRDVRAAVIAGDVAVPDRDERLPGPSARPQAVGPREAVGLVDRERGTGGAAGAESVPVA